MDKEARTVVFVNLFMGVIMGTALSITGQVLEGKWSLLSVMQKFVMSFSVGYLFGSLFPCMKIGKKLAHAVGVPLMELTSGSIVRLAQKLTG